MLKQMSKNYFSFQSEKKLFFDFVVVIVVQQQTKKIIIFGAFVIDSRIQEPQVNELRFSG